MFEFVNHKETGESALMINEGEYDNIVFKFLDGKIKLTDEYNPNDKNIFDNEFKDFLGEIFMTLMYESVNTGNYRLNDENRNDNTEQPTTE